VEVEMAAGVRHSHLAAVRGQCQNRQIQDEGGVLRARTARLAALALVAAVQPNYPSAARKEGREGQVELIFDIDPNGKPFNIEILTSSKHDDLNRAAIKAVEERKFAPSESGIQGERTSITFQLDD
jgi:TonB family protein